MNVFETSNQISRLNKLIDQLKFEIDGVRQSKADLMARIEQNERTILNCPKARQNTRLRMEINEMKRDVLKHQQKIMEYERKLSKNKFLRQSKISTLPIPCISYTPKQENYYGFDWVAILKFVN
ncbi:MAG TPA: hypothetical protein VK957_10840 [Lunatimonas sp.]|nr:hypothetical protein [Lunatimonas sp.]